MLRVAKALAIHGRGKPETQKLGLGVRRPGVEWKTGQHPKMEKPWPKNRNGPRPEMGEKWPKKGKKGPQVPSFHYFWGKRAKIRKWKNFGRTKRNGPRPEMGKNGPKMAKKDLKSHLSPFLGHFSPCRAMGGQKLSKQILFETFTKRSSSTVKDVVNIPSFTSTNPHRVLTIGSADKRRLEGPALEGSWREVPIDLHGSLPPCHMLKNWVGRFLLTARSFYLQFVFVAYGR